MFNEMTRPYTLRKRAQKREETRARIIEAVVALHQEVGPLHTTISAVAERAGVERLTVYRHFPDEPSLFAACSSHYMTAHHPPDPATWMAISDPRERTQTALTALYSYYRKVAPMFTTVLRDAPRIPALQPFVTPHHAYLEAVGDGLYEGFAQASDASTDAGRRHATSVHDERRHEPPTTNYEPTTQSDELTPTRSRWEKEAAASKASRLRVFLNHAVQFTTWETLSRHEPNDEVLGSIMVAAVAGVARGCAARR
jgi:AcrR family transcriptional regulator